MQKVEMDKGGEKTTNDEELNERKKHHKETSKNDWKVFLCDHRIFLPLFCPLLLFFHSPILFALSSAPGSPTEQDF